MKTIRPVFFLLLLLVSPLSVASPAEDAKTILDQGGVNVIENLVEIGKVSSEAAAAVIEVVARNSPSLLRELMVALANVMAPQDFNEAAELAALALSDNPALALLVTENRQHAATPGRQDRDVRRDEERRQDAERRVGERPPGQGDGDDEEPPPGLLEFIFQTVQDVLQLVTDLVASPS